MSFDNLSDSENDVPDWLKGLQSEGDSADFEPESADIPSWMDEEEGTESAPAPGSDDVPDWLANIREQEKDEEEDLPTPETGSLSPEDKQDTANWLEKIRVQYARDTGQLEMPPEEPAQDSSDYLERVQALKQQDMGEVEPDQAQEDEWLGGLMGDTPEEPEPDDSGWGMSTEETAAVAPAGIWDADETVEELEDEGPDWLSGLPSIDTDMLSDETPEETAPESGEDIPQWLRGMEPDSGPTPEGAPTFTTSELETPDWLGDFSTERGDPEFEEQVSQEAAAAAEAVDQEYPDLPGEPGEGALPNWLQNLEFGPEDSKPGEDGDAIRPEDYTGEDVSSMLFEADDLPEWLSEEAPAPADALEPESTPPPATPPPIEADGDIAPAELPSWLQAMRPIEAVTARVSEELEEAEDIGEQERVGPLAGLSDVLPAEPHIIHFGTRATPVTGFQLSPAQKTYTQVLKSMVDDEAAAPPVTRRQVALPQQFLRWVIAILLMLVVFIGVLADSNMFDLQPVEIPAEEVAVLNLIESLNSGSKVLVAFEYQPGFSGEMEAAAEAVLYHLLMRGVDLSLISTQATGPDIAERLLADKLSMYPQISTGQYSNLGFIPGGAAGLANFAASPNQATSAATVQNITEFAMVLVITDDPDLARTWVEQVQTRMDPNQDGSGTPLVMVVSAQAEPLVYPYYTSSPKQVAGIVSGIVGGVYYENQVALGEGTAHNYWFAYNLTLIIAVVLIGGISLINLLGSIFRNLGRSSKRGKA